MGYNFLFPERDQQFLLPPDMRDWLGDAHVVWCVLDAVDQLDLAGFRVAYRANGQGAAAHDPAMMLTLLLYAYCVGERSSRSIERRCTEDVAFRVICGGHHPDHATIARFRARHQDAIKDVFSQVLALLAAAGLVRLGRVSLDGTKIKADAAWSANKTLVQIEDMLAEAEAADAAEDVEHGTARGDEVPDPLTRQAERRVRLRAARDRLAAEAAARAAAQQAKHDAWAARRAAGGARGPGRRPNPEPPAGTSNGTTPRANVTDPGARTMKSKHTLLVGYNAQAVVTDNQVVVGATVTAHPVDRNLLHPVLNICRIQLGAAGIDPTLSTVITDSGYTSEAAFATAHAQGLRLLAPLAKDTRKLRDGGDPTGGRDLRHLPETARGQRRLRHRQGRADYRQRGRTVEPVFGQIKTRQKLTSFSRRGLDACDSEWHLACTAHNLLKLHRNSQN